MARHENPRGISLPQGWPQCVKSAVLNVIALSQYAMAYTRSWAVNDRIARVRLKAENDELRQQVAVLTEEMRIKDARMKRVDPQKRPDYVPTEHMAILELRAARAWSVQQTAKAFGALREMLIRPSASYAAMTNPLRLPPRRRFGRPSTFWTGARGPA